MLYPLEARVVFLLGSDLSGDQRLEELVRREGRERGDLLVGPLL